MAREFGVGAARRKRRLLADIAGATRCSGPDLVVLHDTLSVIQAYPDDRAVLDGVRALITGMRARVAVVRGDPARGALFDSGVPGAVHSHPFSFGVVQRLLRLAPDCVEIDWDELDARGPLHDALAALVGLAEAPSLDDVDLDTRAWLERARPGPDVPAIRFVVDLFERSPLDATMQATLFESCAVPVRYTLAQPGTGRAEAVALPAPGRVHYQKRPLERGRRSVAPRVRRPPRSVERLGSAAGQRWIDRATLALCSRNIEIYPLTYAEPRDVTRVGCDRGFEVVLIGVQPEFRAALESLFFFTVVKNGTPLAYGPLSLLLGCGEIAMNLFEEFRGVETRAVLAQAMRAMFHVVGARCFALTAYFMGKDNDEAIDSGAFWFYHKLGFVPDDPSVDALARRERARMRAEPGYRCDRETLRALARSGVQLDLSDGACRAIDSSRLALRVTERVEGEFDGDRLRAERTCARRLARALQVDLRAWSSAERRALRRLAPLLTLIDALGGWPSGDRRALARALRCKAARSEADFARRLTAQLRCAAALRGLAE